MKIAINCRSFLNKNYTGIGRYAYNLVKSLSEIDDANQYFLYAQKGLFQAKRVLPNFNKNNFKVKRDILNRGVEKTVGDVDIYHSPSQDFVDIYNVKIIVTLHDLVYKAFPQGHTEETLKITDEQISSFLPKVSKIICPSENTRKDLHRFFDVAEKKSVVIPQGVDNHIFYKMDTADRDFFRSYLKENGIISQYILTVGTIEPRKNLKGTIKAFSVLKKNGSFDGKLVVVGMKGWKSNDIKHYTEELGISDDVIFLGFISDKDLRGLYNLAEVFVFPSFYEGFGYPILEAFSCGCPVVTSKTTSCGELSGDAALTVDPTNNGSITDAIKGILLDKELKKQLSDKALGRAKEYTFKKTAEKTLGIYKEVFADEN